jgi:hypothetical protein
MSENAKKSSTTSTLRPLFLLSVVVFLVWLGTWAVLFFAIPGWTERGQFGDMFGAVNSLFSGLAFAGVIFTIYLQREELSLQRKELELTRTQLARSADAQEKSEQALAKQVEALRRASQLSALSSIIDHYEIKISRTPIAAEKVAAQKQQLAYVTQLEQELHALSKLA